MTRRGGVVGLIVAVLFGMGSPSMAFAQQPAKVSRIGYLSLESAPVTASGGSELLPVAGLDYVGPLPAEIQTVTVFSAGIAAGAANADTGKALIKFLASPEAAPAIAKSALDPMTSR